ncbi:response regulator transcription factor [Mangrovibrevibacter kandeliae]|uniref:response regulator transcription factor n=1 Tax=Mangrovibrevibacter kandeliae TaxID=2968473 RepID=UPI002118E9A3|nr:MULTISPECIES: response regulator [unclassified Aurantimonas]MCQ8782956.1 response regulator [Aurantimonas sp. CSK15Z-1]MCW4115850.1 response regulator [Aurantimonas sp. MSK8Z-1]
MTDVAEMVKTVCLVDDDPQVLASLTILLERAGFKVGAFGSAHDFFADGFADAGCLIVDMKMPEMTGIEVQRRLGEEAPTLPVVVLSGSSELKTAVEAMKLGAVDFLEKPFNADTLLATVEKALAEGHRRRAEEAQRDRAAEQIRSLSPRELEVLERVARGEQSKVIAFELGISPRTVEIHRVNILRKTGLRNVADLVHLVERAGPRAAHPANSDNNPSHD